jgi:hypothetical protein
MPTYVPQSIPEGFATKVGKLVPLLVAIFAACVEIFDINLSADTLKLLAGGMAPLVVTQVGRYAQGYAQQRDAPSPVQLDDYSGQPDLDMDLPEHPAGSYDEALAEVPEGAVGGKPEEAPA